MTKASGGKATLLLVDDEQEILEALGEQLSWEGYRVVTALGAAPALEALGQMAFAVVISDQRMPGMSGLELMAKVRSRQPTASRVLITGVLSLDTLVSAINDGEIFRFLTKPWLRAELLATVENAVQRHLLLEANARLQDDAEQLNQKLTQANSDLQLRVAELLAQKEQLDEAHEALSANFEHSLGLCYRIVSTFDPLLGQQTKAVVDLCRQMAQVGNFSPQEKHVLMTSAWLHEIGLIGLDRQVLHRLLTAPESCTPEERGTFRNHPIYGQTLAAFVDRLSAVGETIRAHHERFDGRGFPDGLAHGDIPWTARCLAVAAACAQGGLPREQVLPAISAESGKAFDPAAVHLLERLPQRPELPRQVRELPVNDLRPGMQLARGIYSPTGMLLIAEGQELTPATIARLGQHNARLFVYR